MKKNAKRGGATYFWARASLVMVYWLLDGHEFKLALLGAKRAFRFPTSGFPPRRRYRT